MNIARKSARLVFGLVSMFLIVLSSFSASVGIASAATPSATAVTHSYSAHDTTTYSCPSGGTLSGTTCSVVASSTYPATATYSCPNGAVVSGSQCVTNSTPTATYACSPGDTVLTSTTCQSTKDTTYNATATYSCKSGDTFNGTSCTTSGTSTYAATATVAVTCPSGGTLSGSTCTVTGSSSYAATPTTTYSCPSGGTLSGTTCQVATFSSYPATGNTTYSCPSGGSLSGTTCTISSSYAASGGGGGYSCPPGDSQSGTTCAQAYGAATATPVYNCNQYGATLSGTECYKYAYGVTTTTEANYLNNGYTCGGVSPNKTCTQDSGPAEIGSYTYSCPGGATVEGSNCVLYSSAYYVSNPYSCPSGGSLSGTTCYSTSSYGASPTTTYSCPSGGSLSGSSCMTGSISSYGATPNTTYSCSSGGTLNGQTCTTSGTTTYAATSTTTYTCPTGGTLSGSTCTVSGTSTYNATAAYACATGGTLGGSTCTVSANTTYSAIPTYACASGSVLNGANCTVSSVASPVYTCASNDKLSGTTCTASSSSTYQATPTTTTTGTTVTTTIYSATVTATDGKTFTSTSTVSQTDANNQANNLARVYNNSLANLLPVSLKAQQGDHQILLSWTVKTAGLTYTVIARDITTGTTTTNACVTKGDFCLVNGLTNGDSYTFSIVATGKGLSTKTVPTNTINPAAVANAPISIHAVRLGGNAAKVSWNTPRPNGTTVIIGYTVDAIDTTTPQHGGQSCITIGKTCTVQKLFVGDHYTFIVSSTNRAGVSLPSRNSNVLYLSVPHQMVLNFSAKQSVVGVGQVNGMRNLLRAFHTKAKVVHVTVFVYGPKKSAMVAKHIMSIEAAMKAVFKGSKKTESMVVHTGVSAQSHATVTLS